MKPSLYGKNPGKLKYDKDYIKNCSELELFIQVNKFYAPIKMYNQYQNEVSYLNKMINFYRFTEEKELEDYFISKTKYLNERLSYIEEHINDQEWLYAMDFTILQSSRFGTNIKYNPEGRIILTEEFNNWYDNWHLYIANMDKATLNFYRTCRYENKHLDKFNLENPIINENNIETIDITKPYTYKLKEKSIRHII